MNRERLLALLLIGSLVVPALATTAAARPPPTPVCGVCGDAVVTGATVEGPVPRVQRTELTIRIGDDGVGHFTARTTLAGDAARVDAGAVRERARELLDDRETAAGYRHLRVAVEEGTVVVRFAVPGVAHEGIGGVLVVDHFYWHGDSGRWFRVDADRVTVRGPTGMALTSGSAVGHSEGNAVVWERSRTEWLPEETFLAFAPGDGVASEVATKLAIGVDVAAVKLADLPGVAALPAGILAGLVALLWRYREAVVARSPLRRVGIGIGVAVGLGTCAAAVAPLLGWAPEGFRDAVLGVLFPGGFTGGVAALGAVAILPLAYVLATGLAPRLGARPTRAAVRSAVTLLGLGSVATAVALGSDAAWTRTLTLWTGLFVPALFLSFGVATEVDRRAGALLAAGIACSPVAIAAGATPYGGFESLYYPMAYVPWALVTAVAGTVAFAAGVAFARGGTTGFERFDGTAGGVRADG